MSPNDHDHGTNIDMAQVRPKKSAIASQRAKSEEWLRTNNRDADTDGSKVPAPTDRWQTLLALQRTHGNFHVQRVVSSVLVQRQADKTAAIHDPAALEFAWVTPHGRCVWSIPAERGKEPYTPGGVSETYRQLQREDPRKFAAVNKIIEESFREGAGITHALDWDSPEDRPWARIWLMLRDRVITTFEQPAAEESESEAEEEPTIESTEPTTEPTPSPGAGTATFPGVAVAREIRTPLLPITPLGSPVTVDARFSVKFKGNARHRNPATEVTFEEFGAKVEEKFKDVSFVGKIEPGRLSKCGLKLGTEFIDIMFAANADLTKMWEISFEKTVGQENLAIADLRFSGTVGISVSLYIKPTASALIDLMQFAHRAGRVVATVSRGLLVGEFSGATVLGTAAGAAALSAAGIAWVGAGLYMVGEAHRKGRARAIALQFSTGYADMLALLTSERPLASIKAGYFELLNWEWEAGVKERTEFYLKHGARGVLVLPLVVRDGQAAILQEISRLFNAGKEQEWDEVRERHREMHGETLDARKQAYLKILSDQVMREETLGVPIR